MLKRYGETGSLEAVEQYFAVPARLFSYVLPPVLAIGVFLAPPLVGVFLPDYIPGVAAAQVSIWGAFCLGLHSPLGSFLSASGQVGRVLRGLALLIPVSLLLQFQLARSGVGITAVAWAGLATLLAATVWEMALARLSSGDSPRQAATAVGTLFAPMAFSILTATALESFLGPAPETLPLKAAAYLVLYAPVLFVYEGRFALLRRLRRKCGK